MVFPILLPVESSEPMAQVTASATSGSEAWSIHLVTLAVLASQVAGTIIGEPSWRYMLIPFGVLACSNFPIVLFPFIPA